MEPSEAKELQEIKLLVQQIAERLGIGQTRPADIIDIRLKARAKAEKLVNQKSRQG
jgi:predicted XRE-type DNA-binding protein